MTTRREWTDDELRIASTGLVSGASIRDIQRQLPNRSYEAVRLKIQKLKIEPFNNPDVTPFEESAKDSRIQELEARLQEASVQDVRPMLSTAEEDTWDAADEWRLAESRAAKNVERIQKRGIARITFDNSNPIAIAAISDQHIDGNGSCDLQRMREDAEIIRDTPNLYAILGGDGVDNHIKHKAAMIKAQSNPDTQWRLYDYYLQIFSRSILAVVTGNHDAWTAQIGGVDMVKRLANENKLFYAGDELRLTVQVGSHDYEICCRHQYRFNSSLNQNHTVKRLWSEGARPFDIGIVCHHHEVAMESFRKHGLMRWACRPGSYQVNTGYGLQYGFNHSAPYCPTFILFPDKREIMGFFDVRQAVWAMEKG